MFRIRRVYDGITPANREAIQEVQNILKTQISALPEREVAELPKKLLNPLKYRFRAILFIAEDKEKVQGFALLSHEPVLNFCYLDYIATGRKITGRGIGVSEMTVTDQSGKLIAKATGTTVVTG